MTSIQITKGFSCIKIAVFYASVLHVHFVCPYTLCWWFELMLLSLLTEIQVYGLTGTNQCLPIQHLLHNRPNLRRTSRLDGEYYLFRTDYSLLSIFQHRLQLSKTRHIENGDVVWLSMRQIFKTCKSQTFTCCPKAHVHTLRKA